MVSCQESHNKNLGNKSDKNLEEQLLQKQIQNGYLLKEDGLDASSNYQYTKQDFLVSQQISLEILKNSGYIFPSANDFNAKIKEVYKVNTSKDLVNFLIEYPCPREKIVYQLDGNYVTSNNNPLFIDTKNKILSEALFIPELIDYKTKFPAVAKLENNIPATKKDKDGTVYKIIKWKDFEELTEVRNDNIQKLINRNKFLFNNDKASFDWLRLHDQIFLESLVKNFGYVKDANLLAWYIDKYSIENFEKNKEDCLSVFYVKNCNDSFEIHPEAFTYMEKDATKYSSQILSILDEIRSGNLKLNSLNFSEQSKLVAYLLYFGEKHKSKTGLTNAFMGSFYKHSSPDLQKKYDEEFRKNKYYQLPSFEKLWNDAKIDGDGLGLDM